MEKGGIYKITNPKGEIYIGYSKNIPTRWGNYKSPSKTKGQPKLKVSFEKYGISNHIFELIENLEESFREREKYWIKLLDTFNNGLNSNPGGGGVIEHTDVTKKLISEKGRANIGKRKDSHWKGKKRTDENKKNLSKAKKGIPNPLNAKHVIQYNKNMEYITEYPSIEQAAISTGGNPTAINNALKKGGNATSAMYIWRYKN